MSGATVIICAHTMDRWDVLSRAVSAVNEQVPAPDEVIVVVDNNPDLLDRALLELTARVVPNELATGSAGSRNTGVDLADSPVIVFLDDDAVPEPDWLAALLAPMDDGRVLGVGGRTVPEWLGRKPSWLPPELYWVVGCDWPGMVTKSGRMRNPISVNMAVLRDVYLEAGGMGRILTRVGAGSSVDGTAEETEMAIRINELFPDRYWVQSPNAVVRHQIPRGRTTWSYFVARCRVEGRSKAKLSRAAGSDQALESERAYVSSVLPAGVLRDLQAALRGDPEGVRRATAVVAALGITGYAYLYERAHRFIVAH